MSGGGPSFWAIVLPYNVVPDPGSKGAQVSVASGAFLDGGLPRAGVVMTLDHSLTDRARAAAGELPLFVGAVDAWVDREDALFAHVVFDHPQVNQAARTAVDRVARPSDSHFSVAYIPQRVVDGVCTWAAMLDVSVVEVGAYPQTRLLTAEEVAALHVGDPIDLGAVNAGRFS